MHAGKAIMMVMSEPGNRSDMVYPPVRASEIKELMDSCSADEWQELGRQACEMLGEKFEA